MHIMLNFRSIYIGYNNQNIFMNGLSDDILITNGKNDGSDRQK